MFWYQTLYRYLVQPKIVEVNNRAIARLEPKPKEARVPSTLQAELFNRKQSLRNSLGTKLWWGSCSLTSKGSQMPCPS